ncbi:MAG: hypothetical protein ABIO04_04665 [Ferruginibacter sp.]
MKANKTFFLLLIAAFSFTSCQKDLDVLVVDPVLGPDSTWYDAISPSMPVVGLKNSLLLDIHQDSFIMNTTATAFTASSGLQLLFTPASLLTSAGMPALGEIKVESYLLKKKGDMIRMGTPTTSDGKVLVSGGELYVRLLKDGAELQVSQNSHVNISYADTGLSSQMELFYGDATNSSGFNWLPNADSSNFVIPTTVQTYQLLTNRLHWINCDYFYDTSNAFQTTVSAVLPSNYTNANTIAYIVFSDIRSVIAMNGNSFTRKFSSGKLPVNKSITMVIISKQGDNYFLGHQQAITTGTPGAISVQEITVTPVITSANDIKTYLDSL